MSNSKGYSCHRKDWTFISENLPDGSIRLVGVVFSDGHLMYFKNMPIKQTEAYLRASGIKDPKKLTNIDGDN